MSFMAQAHSISAIEACKDYRPLLTEALVKRRPLTASSIHSPLAGRSREIRPGSSALSSIAIRTAQRWSEHEIWRRAQSLETSRPPLSMTCSSDILSINLGNTRSKRYKKAHSARQESVKTGVSRRLYSSLMQRRTLLQMADDGEADLKKLEAEEAARSGRENVRPIG